MVRVRARGKGSPVVRVGRPVFAVEGCGPPEVMQAPRRTTAAELRRCFIGRGRGCTSDPDPARSGWIRKGRRAWPLPAMRSSADRRIAQDVEADRTGDRPCFRRFSQCHQLYPPGRKRYGRGSCGHNGHVAHGAGQSGSE